MRKTLLIPLVAAVAAATQVQAQSPELEQPFALQSAGEILDIGERGHAQPLFADWDGDGLKDLLVGQFGYMESAGAVRVYKNIGTAKAPKYDGFTYIEANGRTDLVPTGWCVGSGPQLADMNNDGIRDIVSGSWDGELFLIPGRKDGSFGEPEIMKDANGEEIYVGKASVLVLEDWDRDGDLDLTVGTIGGEVYFIPSEAGKFGVPTALMSGNEVINGHHGGPEVVDWDGNGTLDLLLADGEGRVRFFPNKTTKGMPELGAEVELIPAVDESSDELGPGIRAKIDVVDYNCDGKLDLLLGDAHLSAPDELELTEAQLKDKADSHAAFMAAIEKSNALYGEQIMPEVKRRMDAIDPSLLASDVAKTAKFHNVRKAVVQSNPEFSAASQEVDRWAEDQNRHYAPPNSSGYVWVFLRK